MWNVWKWSFNRVCQNTGVLASIIWNTLRVGKVRIYPSFVLMCVFGRRGDYQTTYSLFVNWLFEIISSLVFQITEINKVQ